MAAVPHCSPKDPLFEQRCERKHRRISLAAGAELDGRSQFSPGLLTTRATASRTTSPAPPASKACCPSGGMYSHGQMSLHSGTARRRTPTVLCGSAAPAAPRSICTACKSCTPKPARTHSRSKRRLRFEFAAQQIGTKMSHLGRPGDMPSSRRCAISRAKRRIHTAAANSYSQKDNLMKDVSSSAIRRSCDSPAAVVCTGSSSQAVLPETDSGGAAGVVGTGPAGGSTCSASG